MIQLKKTMMTKNKKMKRMRKMMNKRVMMMGRRKMETPCSWNLAERGEGGRTHDEKRKMMKRRKMMKMQERRPKKFG